MDRPSYLGINIAVERRPNGTWRVGPAGRLGIADRGRAIDLKLGQLSELGSDDPEAREGFLRELRAHQAEHTVLVADLVGELDLVLTHFHGSALTDAWSGDESDELELAAAQAVLCRIWLDFLQGPEDYQAGMSSHPTVLFLWRRSHAALAILYEADWQGWRDVEAEYRRALRNWSRVLMDPANGWFVWHLRRGEQDESEAMAWEREVRHLIWRTEDEFRRFFREQSDGRRLLDRLLRQWFLPRYDLIGAGQVLRMMLAGDRDRWFRWLFDEKKGMPWGVMGISAVLLFAGAWLSQIRVVAMWGKVVAGAGFVAAIVLLLAVVFAMLRIGRGALYPFAPRLAAGTLAGFVAVSGLGEQVADFAFNAFCDPLPGARPYGWLAAPLLVVSLGASLVYLIADAHKVLDDGAAARRRALWLFGFGWAQAIVLAALFSVLAAGRLTSTHLVGLPEPCHALSFGMGVLYPDFIVTASILGLAVGVLTQILWQERGVLDPL